MVGCVVRFRRKASIALAAGLVLAGATAARADDQPLRQTIDKAIRGAWEREKIAPAPRAEDAEFLRRVYLDLVGTIPTYDEAAKFLSDGDARKREKLIDQLLADSRFATAQADVWDLVLFGRHPSGDEATRKRPGFKTWLAEQFARNQPYDRWVRELLLAEQEGPEVFYVQFRNAPEEAAVNVSRIFLGTQLQCARCHDHPFDHWTQRDFYGMAGFFVRLQVLDAPQASGGRKSPDGRRFVIGERSSGDVLFTGAAKDQKPGLKGEPVKPKFLGGDNLVEPPLPKDFKEPERGAKTLPKPFFSRKEKMAAWIASPENPFFARAVANRVWAQFLGRGLVHPVDDLNENSDVTDAPLLKALTEGLKAQKFDLKWLIRELVNSEVYQLSSAATVTEALPKFYQRARVRPLSAEELLSAIRTATGHEASGQKPGGDTLEYVTRYFGEPTNGQGDFQGSLAEHLFLNHSGNLRQMIQRRKGNLAETLATAKDPAESLVERLFLSVLTRPPKPAERERFVAYLASGAKSKDAPIEDAIWVLLNCAEFRFNH
jgi:hypothetical protein